MRIEDGHGDPLRGPRVGNAVAPRLVEFRNSQRLVKCSRRSGIGSYHVKRNSASRSEAKPKRPQIGFIVMRIE